MTEQSTEKLIEELRSLKNKEDEQEAHTTTIRRQATTLYLDYAYCIEEEIRPFSD